MPTWRNTGSTRWFFPAWRDAPSRPRRAIPASRCRRASGAASTTGRRRTFRSASPSPAAPGARPRCCALPTPTSRRPRRAGRRRGCRRLNLELARDEFLRYLARLVRLRPGFGDPFVDGVLEQPIVATAAGRPIGVGELFLHLGQHVVVECALHDEQRRQGDLFLALEDLLRIAFVDRLPRREKHLVVL